MSRPLPLYVQLKELTKASREKLAKEKLTMAAVRDAMSKAALQGLNWAAIPLGGSSLASTAHARELEAQLKGITFDWREALGRDGVMIWELRLSWDIGEIA
jgi:hypothetical protein